MILTALDATRGRVTVRVGGCIRVPFRRTAWLPKPRVPSSTLGELAKHSKRGLEVVAVSKKSSKRHRRRQQEQESRKAQRIKRHLDRPADPPPFKPRQWVQEPFYLPELGLKKACFDDWSVHREHPPVIRRGEGV